MKNIAAISTLLLSVVSGAPVEQRQATEFDITNFSANTIPHGTGAFLSYDITIPGVLSTNCFYSDQSSVGSIPDITPYRGCADAAVQWQFRHEPSQPGGSAPYLLVITYKDLNTGVTVAGSKEWPSTDFPFEDFGSTVAQFYRGEPNFVVDDVQ
ncbi:hypothetical protein BKA67DRAFT_555559 [Truncatella angustata]|uniref:AA1-like domain-containing protein n=1 Tax=Truncatella angustata TaxID=152316 RepID=A0A9P8USH8_9PEZI|nr:uncharacterized protein BKA67DRAFT_555559 [Truncatella angustata]KAH6657538.1 hypothetical protein BKA67DRAFT_555559 [Truncatella angustata]KAH8201742.1 hypothetical protein TruAng_004094 [Truncatella angustata]